MLNLDQAARATRTQALFREVNEKIRDLNDALSGMTDEYAIACEFAGSGCIETVKIRPEDYRAVRSSPRQFVVLHGHVEPAVEDVIADNNGYVVVEKHGAAGSWRPSSPNSTLRSD